MFCRVPEEEGSEGIAGSGGRLRMGTGGVRMTMLGEKRAEYPSGMVWFSRLTARRESFGGGLGLRFSMWTAGESDWCPGCAAGCVWGG